MKIKRPEPRVTGNSCCLLCWPRQVQSSNRVAKESWGLPSSDCRANRPHLGLCPEANVPPQGRQGSRGCIPDAPGETGIHLEWKQRTPLCSRIATGISWSSLGGLKGIKRPEAFGEREVEKLGSWEVEEPRYESFNYSTIKLFNHSTSHGLTNRNKEKKKENARNKAVQGQHRGDGPRDRDRAPGAAGRRSRHRFVR